MNITDKIKKVLEKRHEKIIIDMYLKNYYFSNSYFALIYNEKIEKFKVLYVPIDAIEPLQPIEEYFCYQFIFIQTVNYILNTIKENENSICSDRLRNNTIDNKNINYIEINTHIADNNYKYCFTEFIDREFIYLFELVETFLEHSPNILYELSNKILKDFNNEFESLRHNQIMEIDLYNDDLDIYYNEEIMNTKYELEDIDYIEKVGNKVYAVINDERIEFEYDKYNYVLYIYSKKYDINSQEIYILLKAIKENYEKKYIRLIYNDNNFNNEQDNKYFLCYGIDKEKEIFKIHNKLYDKDISLNNISNNKIKISNISNNIKKEIKNYLKEKYTNNKVNEIEKNIYVKKTST